MTNTANVADNPIAVTGMLNPSSDTGQSNTDDITFDAQPNFYGTVWVAGTATPEPFAHVTLYANGAPIGTTQAGGDGTWSITSNLLNQGTYAITAVATDQFGQTVSPAAGIAPMLEIDTAPPVITALSFNRFDATLTVSFHDNLSGMALAGLTNSAFYHISARPLSTKVHVPKLILPTSISYTPGPTPTDDTVTVVFNDGRPFRGGKYEVVIDAGTHDAGIQDIAGNALDGNFYGGFPSGDGLAGGNFVASIATFHNVILPFVPIADGYVPPQAGVDPPAGAGGKAHKAHAVRDTKAAAVHPVIHKTAIGSASHKAHDAAIRDLASKKG